MDLALTCCSLRMATRWRVENKIQKRKPPEGFGLKFVPLKKTCGSLVLGPKISSQRVKTSKVRSKRLIPFQPASTILELVLSMLLWKLVVSWQGNTCFFFAFTIFRTFHFLALLNSLDLEKTFSKFEDVALSTRGRVEYVYATDQQALDAMRLVSRTASLQSQRLLNRFCITQRGWNLKPRLGFAEGVFAVLS